MLPASIGIAAPYGAAGPLIAGTSMSPNAIDTATIKTFTIAEYNRSFFPGTRLRATAAGYLNTWIEGNVTAWDGETLSLSPDFSSGAGSYSDWQINVAGQPGTPGTPGSGGGITDAPNDGWYYSRRNLGWAIKPDVYYDLRLFGATAGSNVQPQLAAAYALGYRNFFLPAGFYYQGGGEVGGTPATIISDYVRIYGEDQKTSLIKAVDRTLSTAAGYIYIGAQVQLINCGSQSYPGDQQASPTGIPHTNMQPLVYNAGSATITYVPWTGASHINLANIVSPESITSNDVPGIQIVNSTVGDNFYASTSGSGVGVRVETRGNADKGILVLNGPDSPANGHVGLTINEYGTTTGSIAINLMRTANATSRLLTFGDSGPTTSANPLIELVLSYMSGGNMINCYQATTPFNGNFFNINAGNSGGTFTGNYALFARQGATQFYVTFDGNVSAGASTAIPAGGAAGVGYKFTSVFNFGVFFGSGAPTLVAAKGSLYLRSDGTTTNNRAYIATDSGGAWTALTTQA
jgi:hypothetical protein